MGYLSRLFRRPSAASSKASPRSERIDVCPGTTKLEVVGESHFQDALWRLSRAHRGDRVRAEIVAVLVPDSHNPYDPNAVRVEIDGQQVGHLSAQDAARYRVGLQALMLSRHSRIGLRGVIVGGGGGRANLGVWLRHDPADFGIFEREGPSTSGRPGSRQSLDQSSSRASLRTGFSEAWSSDGSDDSYDLSWSSQLSADDDQALLQLRRLLSTDPEPLSRHFIFNELERRLYRRGLRSPETLGEFDDACQAHDSEMPAIIAAFTTKWDQIPLLETYKQMAIRQQKAKNWKACQWWADRGLAMYGNKAARAEWVADLESRQDRAIRNLGAAEAKPLPTPRTAAEESVRRLVRLPARPQRRLSASAAARRSNGFGLAVVSRCPAPAVGRWRTPPPRRPDGQQMPADDGRSPSSHRAGRRCLG